MTTIEAAPKTEYGLRPGAEEFPLMVVISVIYPCNLGCPFCPYTDGNSDLRKFYHEHYTAAEKQWKADHPKGEKK